MFLDGQSKSTVDRQCVRHDTDAGAWGRRCSSLRSWCAGLVDPVEHFVMPRVRHSKEWLN